VAPSSYYSNKSRPPSRRSLTDWVLAGQIRAVWEKNFSVYGARKTWKAMRRAGVDVGRDRVARLMRREGLVGAVPGGKKVFTTRPDPRAGRAPDLVERKFAAVAPNRLWVTDLTYVPTWSGVAYVSFITDVFSRMIVGWRVASNMRTDIVLESLDMARWSRGAQFDDLICHSDAGSQYTSIRYTERLDEIGARPSIGTVADCTITRWPKQ
jgi:putative transposase